MMQEQRAKKMKRKLTVFLAALAIALLVTTGTYAYTFGTAMVSLDVTAAGGHIVSSAPSPSPEQPDWDEVLPVSEPDQEILRPDGPGDSTTIPSQFPTGGEHWDKVDDISPDGLSTYVYSQNKQDRTDLYSLGDHVEGVNTITGVTVYYVIAADSAGYHAYARAAIKTGTQTFQGSLTSHLGSTFAQYSYTWGINPATGQAWTWAQIDALQAGLVLAKEPNGIYAACTQVFVVVDYELPPIIEGQVPEGNLFVITPQNGYTGDLLANFYITNTGPLRLAYRYLNLKLYIADSVEADETPDYRILSLENGVATFNLEGGAASSYTVEVVGGGYAVISGDTDEWGAGWTHIPEIYCEVVQR
ncbi:MAG: hypothetical protein ABID87_02095 [Chloroflexota bacterium]